MSRHLCGRGGGSAALSISAPILLETGGVCDRSVRRPTANHALGVSVLKNDLDTFARVLFQPKLFRLLAHVVLVPAQHARRGRDSVAEGKGSFEIIDVHLGPGLTWVDIHCCLAVLPSA